MSRYIIQIGLGVGVLLFSIFATLYEGSEIVDRQFEWEYSTPFSGAVDKESDISKFDYIVYAIKFKPAFPIVMAISSTYLLVVAGYLLMNRKRFFTFYLPINAVLQFILGWLMFSSTTQGAQALSYIFLLCGALFVVGALMYQFAPFNLGIGLKKR
ncbi:DUF4306 domain-containing protein [Mangrovibacillus sp. Mu-81]|uniref:DUF4306 domain-containing protein n=1 Tax=Mangrovibacillus sp. Mu-81 TaxID=3121478 RepID=UPI002FE4E3BD